MNTKPIQAQPASAPLPYETIKKLIDQQQWVKIFKKRERVLRGLGEENKIINAETQNYLHDEVMPKVYEVIDKFLIDNSLSLVGYWNFNKIGATVVDKEQYQLFQDNERRQAPEPRWDKFDELHELLKPINAVRIVGSTHPTTGEPMWTVQSQISPELVKRRSELLNYVEQVKSKMREFDTEEAKKKNPELAKVENPEREEEAEPAPQPQPEPVPEQPEQPQNEEEAPKEDKEPAPEQETPVEDKNEPKDEEWHEEPEEAPGKSKSEERREKIQKEEN